MAVDMRGALDMVKARLNRMPSDTALDKYLRQRIMAAEEELDSTGIHLDDSAEDLIFLVDFVTWQYQNRDSGAGMPDWLRRRRLERWLQEHKRGACSNDS